MGFGHQGSDRMGADSRCLVCQWRSIHGACSSGARAGLPKILSAACSLTSNPHPHVCLSLLGLSNARRMHSRTGPRYGVSLLINTPSVFSSAHRVAVGGTHCARNTANIRETSCMTLTRDSANQDGMARCPYHLPSSLHCDDRRLI